MVLLTSRATPSLWPTGQVSDRVEYLLVDVVKGGHIQRRKCCGKQLQYIQYIWGISILDQHSAA